MSVNLYDALAFILPHSFMQTIHLLLLAGLVLCARGAINFVSIDDDGTPVCSSFDVEMVDGLFSDGALHFISIAELYTLFPDDPIWHHVRETLQPKLNTLLPCEYLTDTVISEIVDT